MNITTAPAFDPAARITRVFENVLDDGTPWRHPNWPITVAQAKGRCVRVILSGTPSWADLAEMLLGSGGPCQEFRLIGRELFARMKTPEQIAADGAAYDYDETHGDLHTYSSFHDLGEMFVAKVERARSKPERKRGPLATAIADHIEASGEDTFTRSDLLTEVKAVLEKEGRPVRSDSLARTFDTQIVGTLLEVVPDTDGQELRLKETEA